jgi:hypothetical protein
VRIVDVSGFTVLSTNTTLPSRLQRPSGSATSVSAAPDASSSRTAGRSPAGGLNSTHSGCICRTVTSTCCGPTMVPSSTRVALACPDTGLSMRVNDRLRFASSSAARRDIRRALALRSSASSWSNSCCEMAPTSTRERLRATRSVALRSSASTMAISAFAFSTATS